MKHYYVYIMSGFSEVIYVGVTNNLERRVYEHKNKLLEGFTKKYNLKCLLYFEETSTVKDAIAREKQLKGWSRAKKLNLIKSVNPEFRDLLPD